MFVVHGLYAAPEKTQTGVLTAPPQITAVFSTNSSSMGHRLSGAEAMKAQTATCPTYPTCRLSEGTVWAFCGSEQFKRWDGRERATGICNYYAAHGRWGKCPCAQWPKFASQSELSQSGWAKYFKTVYGEVPATGYPIDLSRFWMLYSKARSSPWPQSVGECPGSRPVEGTLYLRNNAYSPQDTNWIWHNYPYAALRGNTWQEVIHEADPFGDERYGAWFLWAPGSGIYFQLGVTRAFQEHVDAYKYWNVHGNEELARAAAKDNVDSIQFVAHHDGWNWPCAQRDNLAYMGLEIVGAKLVGTYACANTRGQTPSIKAGWQASRSCYCNNALRYLNCHGVPAQMNLLPVSNLTNATLLVI